MNRKPIDSIAPRLGPRRSCLIPPGRVRSDSLLAGGALWWSVFGRRAAVCAGFFSKTFRFLAGNRSVTTGHKRQKEKREEGFFWLSAQNCFSAVFALLGTELTRCKVWDGFRFFSTVYKLISISPLAARHSSWTLITHSKHSFYSTNPHITQQSR